MAKKQIKAAKPLVRGKVVAADVKGLRKHGLKTGEEIRVKIAKHPEKEGAPRHVHVHGKVVEEGLQLVTPASQASIAASLRARADVPAGSLVTFATAKDF